MRIFWKAGDTLMVAGTVQGRKFQMIGIALQKGDNESLDKVKVRGGDDRVYTVPCRRVWMVRSAEQG